MPSKLPRYAFLLDKTTLGAARAVARATNRPFTDLMKAAAVRAAEIGVPPVGIGLRAGERTERVSLHLHPAMKAAFAARAAHDGLSLGTWWARALADTIVAFVDQHREELGLQKAA